MVAGCSDPSATVTDEAEFGADLQATSDTGVIRGVVLDAAVAPVADATVVIVGQDRTTVTDQDGRFGFSQVPPGTYFVAASKLRYYSTQTSVDVLAGVADPPVTKVLLERVPGSEPLVVPMQWDGFMTCSWFIGTLFATGCLVADYVEDGSRDFQMIHGTPSWLQSELDWEHTQPAGENLCMRHYASSGIGGDTLGDVCGPTPLTFQVDGDQAEQTGLGNTRGLERVVWVDFWLAPNTVGVAIDQDFTVYTHHFHNFVPDPDWRFLDDGAYAVPPS